MEFNETKHSNWNFWSNNLWTLDTRRNNGVQFSSKIADPRYYVYKNLALSNAIQGEFVTVEIEIDKESKKIDQFCCAIKATVDILPQLKTIEHVSREISWHIFFLFKRRVRKCRWLRIFYAISTVPSFCRRVRNPTKTNI